MNKIELLQRASTESVPVLRRVTERFRQLFPELKLSPNALERTPNADTFMTTNLRRQYGEIESIENDFVNTQTQKVESKIESSLCEGFENPKVYNLQEFGQKSEVVTELNYIEGLQYGKLRQFKHGTNGNLIEEIVYDTNGYKFVDTFDEFRNISSKDIIFPSGNRENVKFNTDGSQVKTITRKISIWDGGSKIIGDAITKEEKNAKGQIVKLTHNETNWDKNYESFIQINPENGRIVKFSLPGKFGFRRDIRLEAEYTPSGFRCKSYKFSRKGQDILNVVFDEATGKPVQASGTYVDALRKEKNFLSGEQYSEEEIMDKLRFKPIVYGDKVEFRLLELHEKIDSSLLEYLESCAK